MASTIIDVTFTRRWWFIPVVMLINLPNLKLVFGDGDAWIPKWIVNHGIKYEVNNG